MPVINTPNQLAYHFFPISGQVFIFKIRCPNDIHVALTSEPIESDTMYEVFIGGWKNTKSVIRKNRQKPDVVEATTIDIVDGSKFIGFWIRWKNNVISVGRESEQTPFMSHYDPQLIPINYVGITTGWGANGTWAIKDPPMAAYPGTPIMAYAVAPPMGMDFKESMGGNAASNLFMAHRNGIQPNALNAGHTSNGELLVKFNLLTVALIFLMVATKSPCLTIKSSILYTLKPIGILMALGLYLNLYNEYFQ